MGAAIGMNTEDLFNDEDLDYSPSSVLLVNKQPVGKTLGCFTARNNTMGLLYLSFCGYNICILNKMIGI